MQDNKTHLDHLAHLQNVGYDEKQLKTRNSFVYLKIMHPCIKPWERFVIYLFCFDTNTEEREGKG